jgi:hypothetical protein
MKTPKKKTPKKKTPKKVGRPTLYREEYAKLAKKFCLLSATNEKLAQCFEVSVPTIDKWIREIPEFSCAVKEGKELADAEIAEALYHRARGYQCKETKVATHEGMITDTQEVDKHYPPDTRAAQFWLMNRQKWRLTQAVEHSGEVNHKLMDMIEEAQGT